MRILLCAATSVEAKACRGGIAESKGNSRVHVLQTGMGAKNAGESLSNYLIDLKNEKLDWIVSTGFAGSRSEKIPLGSLILGETLSCQDEPLITLPQAEWSKFLKASEVDYHSARLQSTHEIVNENSRTELFDWVDAVDMESYALAKVANRHSIPFQVLRLVSDTPDQPIPNSILQFSASIPKGILSALSEPKQIARFVGQSMKLPIRLKQVWKSLNECPSVLGTNALIFLISILFHAVPCSAYSVDEYLAQVEHSHDGYRAFQEDSEGAKTDSQSADLIFKPQVFSTLQYTYDPRDTHIPALEGDRTLNQGVSTGLREQTPWGLQLQLSLDYAQNTLLGISSPLVTRPTVTNLYLVPVFNWSIWQNFGGKLDRANQRMQKAQSLAQAYGSDFGARALIVEAEGRYWKLAALREVIRLQHESLERAESVRALDSRKAKQRLIDVGDTLLSEAAVQGKELELKSMLTEERSAARSFNASRGIDSDQVSETLKLPDDQTFAQMMLPSRSGMRGDLRVAEQQSIATEAGYEVAHEKLLPNLSVFGSIFALGLNFSMPVDLSLTSDARAGYARQMQAAELNYRRKQFEQESDWADLQNRFQDNLERLRLAIQLEDLQKRKFEDVRKRREHAMTVAFQVFQYELDYLAAAQTRLQIEGTLLGLRAQAKLYADSMP